MAIEKQKQIEFDLDTAMFKLHLAMNRPASLMEVSNKKVVFSFKSDPEAQDFAFTFLAMLRAMRDLEKSSVKN